MAETSSSTRAGIQTAVWVLLGGLGSLWILYSLKPDFLKSNMTMIGAVAGILVYLATLSDPRMGLVAIILAIGVSPEYKVMGVPNFRLEDFLIPVVFVSWVTRVIHRRNELKPNPLARPLIIVVATWFLSLLWGVANDNVGLLRSLLFYAKYMEYFLLMILVHQSLNDESEIKLFAGATIMVAILVGVQGLGEAYARPHPDATAPLLFEGPEGETRNILGGYFVFHILLVLGVALHTTDLRWKVLLLIAVVFLGLPVSMTLSRTSYVALLGAACIFLVMKRPKMVPFFLVLVVLLPIIVSDPIRERASTVLDVFGDRPPASWEVRVGAWRQMFWNYFLRSPLLGFGPGFLVPGQADNEYVYVLINCGLIGLCAFLALLWKMFRVVHEIMSAGETDGSFRYAYAAGFLAGLVGCLIHALCAPTLTAVRTAEMFYFCTGLLLSAHGLSVEESRSGAPVERPSATWAAGIQPALAPARRERFFPLG